MRKWGKTKGRKLGKVDEKRKNGKKRKKVEKIRENKQKIKDKKSLKSKQKRNKIGNKEKLYILQKGKIGGKNS